MMSEEESREEMRKELDNELRQDILGISFFLYSYINSLQNKYSSDYEDEAFCNAMSLINDHRIFGDITMNAFADFLYCIQRMENTPNCSVRSVYYEVCSLFNVNEREEDIEYIQSILDGE